MRATWGPASAHVHGSRLDACRLAKAAMQAPCRRSIAPCCPLPVARRHAHPGARGVVCAAGLLQPGLQDRLVYRHGGLPDGLHREPARPCPSSCRAPCAGARAVVACMRGWPPAVQCSCSAADVQAARPAVHSSQCCWICRHRARTSQQGAAAGGLRCVPAPSPSGCTPSAWPRPLQVVAILAWREFGWRLYGKLGVDYREKGAAKK